MDEGGAAAAPAAAPTAPTAPTAAAPPGPATRWVFPLAALAATPSRVDGVPAEDEAMLRAGAAAWLVSTGDRRL
jgi:hypothetical protein